MGCGAPDKRVEEWVSFIKKIGWVVKTLGYWTGEWFFVQVKYVVASSANCLGGADMQVRSHFGL